MPFNGFYNPKAGTLILCSDILVPSINLKCTTVLNSDATKGINYVSIVGKCTTASPCPSDNAYNIKISNIINRPSVKNFTNAFEIRTYTAEDYKINVGYITGIANLEL